MFEWIRQLAKRDSDTAAVAALGARDLADMGVSRDQALTLAAMPVAVSERVRAMGRVFGVSADELARDRRDWVQMVETCAQCRSTSQCRSFMLQDGHPGPNGAGFCPNRETFAHHAHPA
ncbi:MAG: hypothetical protein JJU15_05730 [Pararhodobacter sp.]|nr:hypothetical protein [Pararhodobacter sp.]